MVVASMFLSCLSVSENSNEATIQADSIRADSLAKDSLKVDTIFPND